jgi:hypothetical protein
MKPVAFAIPQVTEGTDAAAKPDSNGAPLNQGMRELRFRATI